MPTIQHILFPVDFSDRCRQMVPVIRFWARRFHAPITVFHSFSVPPGDQEFMVLQTALRQELQKTAETVMADFVAKEFVGLANVSTVTVEGDPGEGVAAWIQAHPGTLVMLPTHGYTGFRRFLIGSVASKILHDADGPVWTTPHVNSSRGLRPKAPRVILCAIDRDVFAIPLIKWAEWLGGEFGATVKLVHVLPAVDENSTNRGEKAVRRYWETRAKQELAPLMVEAGSKSELILHGGDIPSTLAGVAAQERADLLIIGRGHVRKRLGRLRTHSLGIVSKSPCPVISV